MSVYTRKQISDMVNLYLEAEQKVLSGQSYTIANRSLTRANLSELRTARQEWEQRLINFDVNGSGGSTNYAVSQF